MANCNRKPTRNWNPGSKSVKCFPWSGPGPCTCQGGSMLGTSSYSPPLLTADLPGIGGRIKVAPEDFEVEEIPAYEPSGAGDYLYLWLEKRGMGAEYFA